MTENNDAMHMLYIQKQEQLLVENIRNKIDYEMKLHILNERINGFVEKINEMQQALLAQQDINKQAINSFENSNHEKEQLKLTVQDLESKNKELQTAAHQLTTKTLEFNTMKASYENKIKDLQSELGRQSQELEQLYNSTKKTKKIERVEN